MTETIEQVPTKSNEEKYLENIKPKQATEFNAAIHDEGKIRKCLIELLSTPIDGDEKLQRIIEGTVFETCINMNEALALRLAQIALTASPSASLEAINTTIARTEPTEVDKRGASVNILNQNLIKNSKDITDKDLQEAVETGVVK